MDLIINALKVIHNYLSGRSQKSKVGSFFNDFLDMIDAVHKGPNMEYIWVSEYSSEFTNFVQMTARLMKAAKVLIDKLEITTGKVFDWSYFTITI